MPYVPDDLLRAIIAIAEDACAANGEIPVWDAGGLVIVDALALLPENQPDVTAALRQYADEPTPAGLFLRTDEGWTR